VSVSTVPVRSQVCKKDSADNTVYHCTTCADSTNCKTCENRYYLATVRKYKLCRPCSPLCKTCENENGDKCAECAVGSATVDKTCNPPTCITTNGQAGGTNINCVTCSSDNINCDECKDGYFLERVEPTVCARNVTLLAIHALDH
ncbi:High cysteine membrane protein Group 2, partial [Giardia duodenalis]